MERFENPALKAFVAQIGDSLAFAQVFIRQRGQGYELRHVEDRHAPSGSLRPISPEEARSLAQTSATGRFRPLKAAPDLAGGWRMSASGDGELETALRGFYPGAVADWHAARGDTPPVTDYREFTNRQSGMYRIATLLNDPEAAGVIGTGCGAGRCLKRRLWTVAGLAPDAPAEKSMIPCLEPCAVLLELARKTVRARQEIDRNINPFPPCGGTEID